MEWTVSESLAVQAIGRAAMGCMDRDALVKAVNSEALALLKEIRGILDDGSLDDPECFAKIDALVSAFHRRGVPVSRHDFG